MLCSDHEWGPLDEMLFEEQERQRKLGGEKAKRKVWRPPLNNDPWVLRVIGLTVGVRTISRAIFSTE